MIKKEREWRAANFGLKPKKSASFLAIALCVEILFSLFAELLGGLSLLYMQTTFIVQY